MTIEPDTGSREEIERIRRVSDQLCTAHAALSDRFSQRALLLDIVVLVLSALVTALAFVDPKLLHHVMPEAIDPAIVVGVFGLVVFCFTLVQSKTDWRGRGEAHKLQAIGETASLIARNGFDWLKQCLEVDPLSTLRSLRYIGDVTKWHLAKNIGVDVAKPDRHLVRVAERFGYSDVHRMCREINEQCGDLVSVADLILWRFEERSTPTRRRGYGQL